MTNVVKKVSINGQVVPFGGGGGSGEANETVYLTQAEYDVLTPDEHTDYVIYDTSTSPVGIDAESVSFDNTQTTMQSDNVQDAIEEVFQSVSNGKELLADAITDMGVSTSASDSFQTMASNIGLIGGGAEVIERNEYGYDLLQTGQGTLLYFAFNVTGSQGTSKSNTSSFSVGTEGYSFSIRSCNGKEVMICANESFQTTPLISLDNISQQITGVNLYQVEGEDDYIYISVSQRFSDSSRLRLTKSNFTITNITYDSSKTYIDISQGGPFVIRAIGGVTQYSEVIGFVAKMS